LPRLGFKGPAPARTTDIKGDLTDMPALKGFTALTLVALVSIVLAACTSTTGKTAGENVDDATITSEVKAKLAAEKISTLTKIGVDTDRRTVYLTGMVDDAEMRSKAEAIARSVKHVAGVVNNLTVRAQ
jgi:hyperosmotically inducible periplasmic protein